MWAGMCGGCKRVLPVYWHVGPRAHAHFPSQTVFYRLCQWNVHYLNYFWRADAIRCSSDGFLQRMEFMRALREGSGWDLATPLQVEAKAFVEKVDREAR